MTRKGIFRTIILPVFLMACANKEDVDERAFVPGDIIIGINSTTSIEEIFELMNENQLTIAQMSGFFYYSDLPNDSLDYVIHSLDDKFYFRKLASIGAPVYVDANENRITVAEYFFEMNIEAQLDWLAAMNTLELNDLGNDTKNLLIKVPPGTEKHWKEFFEGHPYVKWVELNYVGGFEPLN